jgi:hypothetical protein
MGFFSWNCKGCGASIKAPYDLPSDIAWQNNAVALFENGSITIGAYDGYGRIAGVALLNRNQLDESGEYWHEKCWKQAKEPFFTENSEMADDQGYFYDYPEDPECGQCVHCKSGKTNICLAIREQQGKGYLPDGTPRLSEDLED